MYRLNKEILDKPADVLGLFRRILIKKILFTLIRHLWFGNWWQQVGICKNTNNSYLVDLEGSAGKTSENHKFLYHSFTFESRSFKLKYLAWLLECKYGGKFSWSGKSLTYAEWNVALLCPVPPGFFVDLVERKPERKGGSQRQPWRNFCFEKAALFPLRYCNRCLLMLHNV